MLLRGGGRLHVFPGDDVGAQKRLAQWLRAVAANGLRRRAPSPLRLWQPYAGLLYFHLLLDGLSQSGVLESQVGRGIVSAHRPGERSSLVIDAGQELIERRREGSDAVGLQLLRHGVDVQAEEGRGPQCGVSFARTMFEGGVYLPVIPERIQRSGRNRGDRILPDQALEGVQDMEYRRILGSGARPQWPLNAGAASNQVRERVAVEDFGETFVDATRIGSAMWPRNASASRDPMASSWRSAAASSRLTKTMRPTTQAGSW